MGGVRVRLIDRVAVKGRKGAISICEFLAPRDALDDTRQELRQIYMDGLCRYGEQDGSGAR